MSPCSLNRPHLQGLISNELIEGATLSFDLSAFVGEGVQVWLHPEGPGSSCEGQQAKIHLLRAGVRKGVWFGEKPPHTVVGHTVLSGSPHCRADYFKIVGGPTSIGTSRPWEVTHCRIIPPQILCVTQCCERFLWTKRIFLCCSTQAVVRTSSKPAVESSKIALPMAQDSDGVASGVFTYSESVTDSRQAGTTGRWTTCAWSLTPSRRHITRPRRNSRCLGWWHTAQH